ncbi:hypothetical protein AAMO2058_001718800 [Amorphochlora amoebiformis]
MPPVFYASIEADSGSDQRALDTALEQLMLEDPSLSVEEDKETGQTLLKGMGELHLEVVFNRLIKDFKVGARLGKMRVAYRETILQGTTYSKQLEHIIKGATSSAMVKLSILPVEGPITDPKHIIPIDINSDAWDKLELSLGEKMATTHVEEAIRSIRDAFSYGPSLGYPVIGVKVDIQDLEITPSSNPSTTGACTFQCAIDGLKQLPGQILEPIVKVSVRVPNEFMGAVLSEITSLRRGQVAEVSQLDKAGAAVCIIHAEIPLAEMVGYATALRASTQGNGTFEMSFLLYRHVGPDLQKKLIEDPYSV